MAKILSVRLSTPLEREFEAWIIEQIREYFDRLQLKADIWAVSPSIEVNWPSDEHIEVNSRLIGLQFKQTRLSKNSTTASPPSYSTLKWDLRKPNGQFELVQKFSEIYYCLPTFINRSWAKFALEHCVFWRPGLHNNYNTWYDNPNARTPYNKIKDDGVRWGRFVEELFTGNIGKPITNRNKLYEYIHSFHSVLSQSYRIEQNDEMNIFETVPVVYFLYIQIPV